MMLALLGCGGLGGDTVLPCVACRLTFRPGAGGLERAQG